MHLSSLAAIALGSIAVLGCSSQSNESVGSSNASLGVVVELPAALGGGERTALYTTSKAPKAKHGYGIPLPAPSTTPLPATPKSQASPAASVPTTVDLSTGVPPVGDQGQTSSCQSWSTGYVALGWWANHAGLASAQFAPMYLYSQLAKGTCSTGFSLEQPLNLLEQQGIDTRSDYEPMQTSLDCSTEPSTAARANAAHFKIAGYTKGDLSGGAEAAIKSALAAGHPPTLAITVYPEFDDADAQSYIVGPPQSGDVASGGHAITAFRYDDTGVWILNQWGTGWGNDGWAVLSWDFVNGSFGGRANVFDVEAISGIDLQCTNSNADCAAWAADSQCQENPNYMLTSCCASCANPALAYESYSFRPLVSASSCMDVSGDETADETAIQEYSCNATAAQVFTVVSKGNGLVNLFHPHSGKCVDIREAGTANGTPIDLYDCNGTAAQEFEALGNSDGSVTFQNPTSGSCLDVADAKTANGTKLDLWGCNGTDAQKWTATPN